MQGTIGTSLRDLNTAASESYDAWFEVQAKARPSLELPLVTPSNAANTIRLQAWWYNAVNGSDQLRQRMAFALSEILVVSDVDTSFYLRGQALASYCQRRLKIDPPLGCVAEVKVTHPGT